MKLKKITLLIVCAALSFMIGCVPREGTNNAPPQDTVVHLLPTEADGIPSLPVPTKAVNDFADVIDDSTQSSLETTLVSFERNRRVALVVVTIDTFDTQKYADIQPFATALFNKWGIGQSAANNGVLLIFSQHPRKLRIETGKGMDGVITDAMAGKLMRQYMQTHMKAHDYNTAFTQGVDGIISYINEAMPTEESKALIAKHDEAEARKMKDILSTIGMYIVGIVLLVLIALGIRRIVRSIADRKKKRELREKAKKIFSVIQKEVQGIPAAIEHSITISKDYPEWARNDLKGYHAELERLMKSIEKELNRASEAIQDEPDLAIAKMNALHERYTQAVVTYKKANEALPNKIASYKEQAPQLKEEMKQTIDDLQKLVAAYLAEGLTHFKDDEEDVSDLKTNIDRVIGYIDDKRVCDEAKSLLKRAQALHISISTEYGLYEVNANRADEIQESLNAIMPLIEKAKSSLEYMRTYAPKSIWSLLESNISRAIASIDGIPPKLKSSLAFNTKEQQKPLEAAALIDSAASTLARNIALLTEPINMVVEWEEAKQALPGKRRDAKDLMARLQKFSKHSDVSSAHKKHIKELLKKMGDAQSIEDNIIAAVAIYMEICKTALMIDANCDNDIRAAKLNRTDPSSYTSPRKSSSNDDSYTSTVITSSPWISSSGSTGNDSVFSGFSGGESGGGGSTLSDI